MSLGNPFLTNCSKCGQSLTMMQMGLGHVCQPADPRIMAELQFLRDRIEGIRTALDKIWDKISPA